MFKWLRDYLCEQLIFFKGKGIIQVKDEAKAADYIVTIMEGLEFHAQFLADGKPFDDFAQTTKHATVAVLKSGEI